MSEKRQNPLALDKESMRKFGYAAVDAIVEYFDGVDQQSVVPPKSRQSLPRNLQEFSEEPKPIDTLLKDSLSGVFDDCMNLIHPRFFAYIPGPGNFVSTVGDLLVSGHNVFAGISPHNLGAQIVEANTIRWLCDLADMPETAGGLFVSGGSVAILTGLAAGRTRILKDRVEGARIYCSDQTHSSVERALGLLGFDSSQLREVNVKPDFRIDVTDLERQICADAESGYKPFCIIGNAGTTNTGAVDPLDELAAIAAKHELWFHVDAAYGGGALLSQRGKRQLEGIGLADSISFDPHKWLFQPYENACVLVKDPATLRDTFRRVPDYMRDSDQPQHLTNYRDMSPQVTRGFKAFKLWLSLHAYGVSAFRQSVDHGLDMAEYFQSVLEKRKNWQVVTPATLGVVTFRYLFDGNAEQQDELNRELIQCINEDGYAFFSSTRIHGRDVNRGCPINPALTHADIDSTVAKLEELAQSLLDNH
ncbi:MAG: aminotransferase class I/II-fold pyridoxal phosphate-dependent enzyme [Pseudomonadota bacterium]